VKARELLQQGEVTEAAVSGMFGGCDRTIEAKSREKPISQVDVAGHSMARSIRSTNEELGCLDSIGPPENCGEPDRFWS
jgi:hypothetical protein